MKLDCLFVEFGVLLGVALPPSASLDLFHPRSGGSQSKGTALVGGRATRHSLDHALIAPMTAAVLKLGPVAHMIAAVNKHFLVKDAVQRLHRKEFFCNRLEGLASAARV